MPPTVRGQYLDWGILWQMDSPRLATSVATSNRTWLTASRFGGVFDILNAQSCCERRRVGLINDKVVLLHQDNWNEKYGGATVMYKAQTRGKAWRLGRLVPPPTEVKLGKNADVLLSMCSAQGEKTGYSKTRY